MKKLVDFLSSLKLTLVLLLLICIWFAAGALFSVSSQYGNTFRVLNDQLIGSSLISLQHIQAYEWSPLFDWSAYQKEILSGLPAPGSIVVWWLRGVFVLIFLLVLNLVFGSKDWFFDLIRKRMDLRGGLLFSIHILFAVVILAHLISAVSGLKATGDMPVEQGQEVSFLQNYRLKIDKLGVEQESLGAGGKDKGFYTPGGFKHERTVAEVRIFESGRPVYEGKVKEFDPLSYQDFQVSLVPFSFRSQVSHDFVATGAGEQIVIYDNPGFLIILIFQPLWIMATLAYVFIILRPKNSF